jgi:glycosyltransferase involved in cell wall biosynthesis
MDKKIAIILPRREGFSRETFGGAIGLCVRDNTLNSIFKNNITIYGGTTKESETYEGLNYKLVKIKKKITDLSNSRAYARTLVKILKQTKPDLIEIHNKPHIASYIKKRINIPICQYIHVDPYSFFYKYNQKFGRKKILKESTHIFCVSEYVKKRLHSNLKNCNNSSVIYNGIDLKSLADTSIANKKNEIIFVGRIIAEKGALELALALKNILQKHKNWQAKFIGSLSKDHNYKNKFLTIIKETENCHYLGNKEFSETIKEFKTAKIAALPSYCNEAFGRTILEAILCKNAVITCNNGGIKEIAGDKVIYAKNHNVKDLENKLEKLIMDQNLREKIIAESYSIAYSKFYIIATTKKLDNIRKTLLENKHDN